MLRGLRQNGANVVRRTTVCLAAMLAGVTFNLECLSAKTRSEPLFIAALVASYPQFLERADGNELVWKDGTRMSIDDGLGEKNLEGRLNNPDIEDQFSIPYPLGHVDTPPPVNSDPGRIRCAPLWDKMYGRCAEGEVARQLVEIEWLPRFFRQKLRGDGRKRRSRKAKGRFSRASQFRERRGLPILASIIASGRCHCLRRSTSEALR